MSMISQILDYRITFDSLFHGQQYKSAHHMVIVIFHKKNPIMSKMKIGVK